MTQRQKRPIGLWVIGLLQLSVASVAAIGLSLVLLALPLQHKVLPHTGVYLLWLIYAGGMVVVAVGVLRWKNWARVTLLALSVGMLIITLAIILILVAAKTNVWAIRIPQLLYTGWIIWYLRRASIKTLFTPEPRDAKRASVPSVPRPLETS